MSLFTTAAGFDEIGCLGALARTVVCIGRHKKGMRNCRLSSPYGSLISSAFNESNNNYNNNIICIILRACTLSGKPGAFVSPWELFCQLLLIFLCSLQPLWLANLHDGETPSATYRKYDREAEQDHIRHSLGTQGPGWMRGGRHESLPPSLGEKMCSITCCTNSCWFGFPFWRPGQMSYEPVVGFQLTFLGCISGLNLPLYDTSFGVGQAAEQKGIKAVGRLCYPPNSLCFEPTDLCFAEAKAVWEKWDMGPKEHWVSKVAVIYSMQTRGGLYAELCGISTESATGESRVSQGTNSFLPLGKEIKKS